MLMSCFITVLPTQWESNARGARESSMINTGCPGMR
nr:MAG TPA: hypothetical protein [Caudoviricetes sp.]